MSQPLRIGVYLVKTCQLLDTSTVDVLAVMSKEYLREIKLVPQQLVDMAPSIQILYITTPDQKDAVPLTANMTIKPHHTYLDEEVAPGKLDVIVVPGPDPFQGPFDAAGGEWLKKHFDTNKTDVLSVCSGLYVCAEAGIVDGRLASGPRGFQEDLTKRFPKIKLVGDKQRWVQDGNLWSSGKFRSFLDATL